TRIITRNYRRAGHLLPLIIFISTACATVCSTPVARCIQPILLVVLLLLLAASIARADLLPDPAGVEFFEKKIRPLLTEHCFECHSAKSEELKAHLLLDTRAGVIKGGDSGPSIVPGDVEKSRIIE